MILVRTHAAGDVHLPADDVPPKALDRQFVCWRVHEPCDIGHGRIEVARAHRVAYRLLLFNKRLVILHATVANAVTGTALRAIALRRR